MFNLNQSLPFIVPITAIIWLFLSINQVRLNKVSRKTLIIYFKFGLLICMIAAFRDGYGFTEAIIPLDSLLSTGLSILGLLLFILMIIGSVSKKNIVKTRLFTSMIGIFIVKFITVELVIMGVIS